ncbi:hypothetical protein PAAG_06386 [Paracoccidioides lutzii Pb01]|uniref:Mucin-7 n=1 Tax=Paracoccidioides lutzii (strain ATCC MYA-826 / Pb01) TaxID=502779 RepID=C1H6J5_PARBA|nr:hypothetical protein PAAG_06386 [Paracoccidioides lutzii Pb01]EEH35339.1 hypothetical protein PAAG_06386 [Paracoccidioides lutzii Pb01]
MSDGRAQTGVRSLLARFENNNNNNSSTSPPSRGRSPIDTDLSGSVRPLSKVRANFVAVERTGRPGSAPMWGLRKTSDVDINTINHINDTNNSSGKLERTTKAGVDELGSPVEMSSDDSADKGIMGNSLAFSAPDNNNINNNKVSNEDGLMGGGSINRPWAANLPSKFTDSPPPKIHTTSGDILVTTTSATEGKPEPGKKASKGDSQVDKSQEKDTALLAASRLNGNPRGKDSPKKTRVSTNPSARPPNIVIENDVNKAAAKKSSPKELKSPFPRSPRTPTTTTSHTNAKPTPRSTSAKGSDNFHAAAKQPNRAAAGKPTSKPQSTVSAREKAMKPSTENPPSTARSRTRSPTRPVRLPNSVIAPTASSAAKLNPDGRPASQAGTNTTQLNRKSSNLRSDRNSISSRATAPNAPTVQKQPSRASSLVPQQNTSHDRPRSRVGNPPSTTTRPADESFLARMMRPTASSASKMHEKIEIKSPPRGSVPPKPRRKSGDSASSHTSMTVACGPPSSKKRVVKAAQTQSNGHVEPHKDPEPDGTQAEAVPAAAVATETEVEVEVAIQKPKPKPAVAKPVPDTVPEIAASKADLPVLPASEPAALEPPVKVEVEPEPGFSEPTVAGPLIPEPIPFPLAEKAESPAVEVDPANIPLPEATESVDL